MSSILSAAETIPHGQVQIITQLAKDLIRPDASLYFSTHKHESYQFWICLIRDTWVRKAEVNSLVQVSKAFNILGRVLEHKYDRPEFCRLANIRLAQLLSLMRDIIKQAKPNGKLRTSSGRGLATIAIEIHRDSMFAPRKAAKRQRRISNRFQVLSQGDPFLQTIFSGVAERIV